MVESYIYYSSVTLFVLGIVALVMALLFRQRSKGLSSLPKDLSPTVFSRTFVVFDPYPAQKKVWHRFLSLLPFVCLIVSLFAVMAVWSMLTNGLLLSVFVIIIGLNITVIEEAPDVYTTARIFIKAVQNKSNLAKGDLKVLNIIQRLAPKIRNYYVGLTFFFISTSIALPYAWEALPVFTAWLGNSVAQASGVNGMLVVQVLTILLLLNIAVLQFVAFRLKNKIFRYEIK
ncbi:hypothetical protein MUP79_01805 [Candidatus Bathyarchaeota archaeon]|nr:hypothetical protein [Candidatus Bathyarchaeota archaeon]